MANISQSVNIEMLEKLPDGTYKRKYPKTRADDGTTFDEHLADDTNPHNTNKSDVGLGNVDNVQQMPVSGGTLEDYTEKLVILTNGTIDLSLGNVFYAKNLSNTINLNFINAKNGSHSFTFIRGYGSAIYVYPANVKWADGNIPELAYAGKTYVLTFMTVDGGINWLGMYGGEF